MKSPDQLFEDKLKSRLSNLSETPTFGAKTKIFDSIGSKTNLPRAWVRVLVLELVLLLVLIPAKLYNTGSIALEKTVLFQKEELLSKDSITIKRDLDPHKTAHMEPNQPVINRQVLPVPKDEVFEAEEIENNNIKPPASPIDFKNFENPLALRLKGLNLDTTSSELELGVYQLGVPAGDRLFCTSLYINFEPNFTYNSVSPNLEDQRLLDGFESRAPFSIDRLGWRGSIGVHQRLSDRWILYGGVSMNFFKVAFDYNLVDAEEQVYVLEEDGLIMPKDNTVHVKHLDKFLGLGVVGGVRYDLKRNELFRSAFDLSVDYQRRINKGNSINGLSEHQLFLYLGYEASYPLNPHLTAHIQPGLGYTLLSQMEQSQVFSVRPINVGLNVGLSYRFINTGLPKD